MYVGSPLDLVQPETLRFKVKEPVALLGEQRFQNVDIRLRVKGGGHVSQVYGETAPFPSLLPRTPELACSSIVICIDRLLLDWSLLRAMQSWGSIKLSL